MKRGQITLLFVIGIVAFVAVALLFQSSAITGQPTASLRTMNIAQQKEQIQISPLRVVSLPKESPKFVTVLESCMSQIVPENQVWMDSCKTDQQECLKTSGTEFCNHAFYYCMTNAYEGFVLRVNNCMKGMGVLI